MKNDKDLEKNGVNKEKNIQKNNFPKYLNVNQEDNANEWGELFNISFQSANSSIINTREYNTNIIGNFSELQRKNSKLCEIKGDCNSENTEKLNQKKFQTLTASAFQIENINHKNQKELVDKVYLKSNIFSKIKIIPYNRSTQDKKKDLNLLELFEGSPLFENHDKVNEQISLNNEKAASCFVAPEISVSLI